MLGAESLGVLLHSLSTGFPDRARNLVLTSDELTEEERSAIYEVLESSNEPAVQARALGDVLRGSGDLDFLANECYRAAFYLGDGLDELRDDPLFNFFRSHRAGRILDKWVHYFPIYTRHFGPYRGRPIKLLEIGVYRGGSLDMWSWFLGPQATLVGVDIDPQAAAAADPRRIIEIGDQTDADFLREVAERHGPFDIVIDDGGHEMQQQIVTAETLFPLLAEGGTFLVEDCHTSYWESYGGGPGKPGTFIEWAKQRLDDVNGYHQQGGLNSTWTESLDAVHWYDSVVVFDKKRRFAPFSEQVGHAEFMMQPRSVSQMMAELVATRDAALAERNLYRDKETTERDALEEEIRLLRAELASIRPKSAVLSDRLRDAKAEVDTARAALRELRRNAARDKG